MSILGSAVLSVTYPVLTPMVTFKKNNAVCRLQSIIIRPFYFSYNVPYSVAALFHAATDRGRCSLKRPSGTCRWVLYTYEYSMKSAASAAGGPSDPILILIRWWRNWSALIQDGPELNRVNAIFASMSIRATTKNSNKMNNKLCFQLRLVNDKDRPKLCVHQFTVVYDSTETLLNSFIGLRLVVKVTLLVVMR